MQTVISLKLSNSNAKKHMKFVRKKIASFFILLFCSAFNLFETNVSLKNMKESIHFMIL